jgi:hypothetical protein
MSLAASPSGAGAVAECTSVTAPASSPGEDAGSDAGGRSFVFLRAPMLGSDEEVQRWLTARGFGGVETFRGPDGTWRGSGVMSLNKQDGATTSPEQEIAR